MFNKYCIFYVSNFEYGEFLYECELILFLDSNSKMINKKFNCINSEHKNQIENLQDLEKNKLEIKAQIDNEENLVENIISKKGSFFDYKLRIIGGFTFKIILFNLSAKKFIIYQIILKIIFIDEKIFLNKNKKIKNNKRT